MRKKTFIINALILTITAMITRIVGVAFRVYMSNRIGAEGIGLFQLISVVYIFCMNFAATGMTITVTRLVTDSIAKNEYKKAKFYTVSCLIINIIISIIVGFIMFFEAEFIGIKILCDQRAIPSLKVLSFSLPFIAISSSFRGYFYAIRKVIKTASEQLLEQIVEIAVFAMIVGYLAPKGLDYACLSIVIGTTAAEVISCIYAIILYKTEPKAYSKEKISYALMFKKILTIFIPMTATYCLRSGLSMIENVLIPKGFKKMGQSNSKSLSIYGLILGMVMPIITFPSVFIQSFSMLLIPEMSEANATNHKKNITHIAKVVFQFTIVFSIMVSGIFFFFANDFSFAIYKNPESGVYISIFSVIIPMMYLDGVVDGMLKGLNQQLHYLSYNLIDSILRVVFIYLLLPRYGIYGLIFVMFFSAILNSTLSIGRLLKVASLSLDIINWIIKPIISILISGKIVTALTNTYMLFFNNLTFKLCFETLCSIIMYLFIMLLIKGIGKTELDWFKNTFKLNKQSV